MLILATSLECNCPLVGLYLTVRSEFIESNSIGSLFGCRDAYSDADPFSSVILVIAATLWAI